MSKFAFCPMCARDLVPPESPQEEPDHPEFEPVLRRCSGCGGPWPMCECHHAAEGAPGGEVQEGDRERGLRQECANAISDVAGKVRRGELGPVDAALVITVDSVSAPPRVGAAAFRLDQRGATWVIENLAASWRAGEQHSRGGIIIPR